MTVVGAAAQEKRSEALLPFQEEAEKKAADWDALAKTLEARLARMLPCDPRTRAAIEEVKAASEARLAAFAQFLQEAAVQAKEDASAAKLAVTNQEARGADMSAERTESELAGAAIDVQMTGLSGSAKQRAALGDAVKTLQDIEAMAAARTGRVQDHIARRAALIQAFRDVSTAAEAVQKALDDEIGALREETTRWSEYYAARLARSQLECAITNQTAGPRTPRKKKR